MKRLLLALIAGAMVFTVAFASAASLGVDGSTVQAGVDTDLRCDANGVNAGWGLETDTSLVTSVRIEDIDPACVGDELFVKVNDSATTYHHEITGASESFSFPAIDAASVVKLSVWIEG
jgi:hypothetical protein